MIPVSFSSLYYVMLLFIFFIINQFAKIILLLFYFFIKNYFDFFTFWDVPECSMFWVLLMVR